MFKHKSTSGSNCFVTFILPEGALFVYQLFAEQSIILNLKQKRNPVSTEFLFCYLTEFCPSLLLLSLYVDKLFNCISKSFTSFKRWNFASRNLYFLTSLRITSFSSRTFTYFKVTKADNLYFFTAF